MTTLLAIDTATDACTIALQRGEERRSCHRVIPRQHQQRLFELLGELLGATSLPQLGLQAIVFGRGPGSFTGLRIAASFAQGLAHSLNLPVVGLSTLEVQARSYLREAGLREPALLVSSIDARIGEIYTASFAFDGKTLQAQGGASVSRPELLSAPQSALPVHAIGSGFAHVDAMPDEWRDAAVCDPAVLPHALDMLEPGASALLAGDTVPAAGALPDYVQERIGWKTLAEQGKKA